MALSSTLPCTTSYPQEEKIYISSASLNLKPSRRTVSLHREDSLDNYTYEWHTTVVTPPSTPPNTPAIPKPLHQSTNHSSYQERSKDLFTPAFTYQEEDDLPTKVDKFMSCERYHSQYNQAMAKKNITQL